MSPKSPHDEYAEWQINALCVAFVLISPCIIIADGIQTLGNLIVACAMSLEIPGVGVGIENRKEQSDFWMRMPAVELEGGRKIRGAVICEDKGDSEREINPQNDSPLFSLPPELRRQVFDELLGGYEFDISFDTETRRMVHKQRRHQSPRSDKLREGKNNKAFNETSNMLGLIGTCRNLYTETISILYSRNTFAFKRTENALQLSLSIPRESMAMIIRVKWTTGGGFENWKTTTPWLICWISETEECACLDHLRDKIRRDCSYVPALFQLGMLDGSSEALSTSTVSRELVRETGDIEGSQ